jgi:hypothetical protein
VVHEKKIFNDVMRISRGMGLDAHRVRSLQAISCNLDLEV